MKRFEIVTILIAVFCVGVFAFTRVAANNIIPVEGKITETTTEAEETTTATTEPSYLLMEYDGFLAVYDSKGTDLLSITTTKIDTLPLADQKKLKEGISITGNTSLRKALEDYCS